ncbi:GSCOCT00014109001.2-RA-CDS [Cotesia congregata]|uniref:Cc_pif4 19kDa n=2 Tax=Cotesia congregata TaxID=51543 RepID=A0A8J2H5T5_COTCN|nr:GSCOCT00014109001.2-RA-CDS [Cotesia congregata]CAG5076044.1 Cc_pif4 19kDa [Cotesia congregata]
MDPYLLILMYVSMILILCAKVISLKYSDASAEKIFEKVSSDFNFQPTFLEIYEQSTRSKCNRLILMRPYEWAFWAVNGQCFVLNALKEFDCPSRTSPTLIFDALTTKLSDPNIVCLPVEYDVVKSEYSSYGPPIINYFNIEDVQNHGRFTIYDALNYLLKNYIEINLDPNNVHPANKIMIEIIEKREKIDLTPQELLSVKKKVNSNFKEFQRKLKYGLIKTIV